MTHSFPKYAVYGFLITSVCYLASLSSITYPLTTLLKPLPIICLIYGVLQSALLPRAKILMVAALGFSCLGDIVLTLPVSLVLESGIGFFLVAHCFYIAVLLKAFKFRSTQLFYYLPIFCVMIFLAIHLMPYLGTLLIPVMIYFAILMLMVFSAFQANAKGLLIRGGAISFMISDLTLAYYLFAYPEMNVRVFIMLTYYMAQGLLTWGLVILYKKNELANELNEHSGFQFR